MAINLGYGTDTTGAVTVGSAGLLYGIEGKPNDWLNKCFSKKRSYSKFKIVNLIH